MDRWMDPKIYTFINLIYFLKIFFNMQVYILKHITIIIITIINIQKGPSLLGAELSSYQSEWSFQKLSYTIQNGGGKTFQKCN